MTIGFIGTGNMGGAIAKAVARPAYAAMFVDALADAGVIDAILSAAGKTDR